MIGIKRLILNLKKSYPFVKIMSQIFKSSNLAKEDIYGSELIIRGILFGLLGK